MMKEKHYPAAAFYEDGDVWRVFERAHAVVTADCVDAVVPCLLEIERYIDNGWHAAGYIGYEAAPAFDDSLDASAPDDVPLLQFGIFKPPVMTDCLVFEKICDPVLHWKPSISHEEYRAAIDRIKDYIARGDTYQVNYTFRLYAPFDLDPWNYFCTIAMDRPMPFAAFIDSGRYKVCSFSPELFFRLDGSRIIMQPMKGTAGRGRFTGEDLLFSRRLQSNGKERAENVMIVDMVRNDLGRIAAGRSVAVTELCVVRKYPSILQMISTVEAEVTSAPHEIFAALFPCASVTGAPKIRTSEIIREFEPSPRHVYCGAIGWFAPGRKGRFSVAIRTLLVDSVVRQAEYGTGSGIVWESDVDREYRECILKASIVTSSQRDFRLVETLLWTAEEGYFLLDRHIDRMVDSAAYFSFRIVMDAVKDALIRAAASFNHPRMRVRLIADRVGSIRIETSALTHDELTPQRVVELRVAGRPVDKNDCFLFHKTDCRIQYDALRQEFPSGDDLLFWNEEGEVTETTIGNIVAQINGSLFTPPVECGLLPGVFRASLLAEGTIKERRLNLDDLINANRLFRINSVRKWQQCTLAVTPPAGRG